MTNVPLISLVYSAYHIIIDDQISGLPGWARSDRYDIQAKMDEQATAPGRSHAPGAESATAAHDPGPPCRPLPAQVHRETKQLPVYDLVIAKGGLK